MLDHNYVTPIFYANINMTAMQDSCTDKDRVFPCQQQLYVGTKRRKRQTFVEGTEITQYTCEWFK